MNKNTIQQIIAPAKEYTSPKDLWVVSTYFNSEGYASKLRALHMYLKVMERSGIPMLLVEGAFGKRPFLLPASDHILHVRCTSVMWQKERLLNYAIEHLPSSCRKVAWVDADVFFENPDWAVETSALLDRYPVVQPFDLALWLPKGATDYRGYGLAWSSYAAVTRRHPGIFLSGDFDRHGHSGYAWAAHRELLDKNGLFDLSIIGSGDHLMAHAMCGDLWSPCVTNSVGIAGPFRDAFERWAKPVYGHVRSDMDAVPGAIFHYWHGDRHKRQYYRRMLGLLAHEYDPTRDVRRSPSGGLEWTEHGSALKEWMRDYFIQRVEDARPDPVPAIPTETLQALRNVSTTEMDRRMQALSALLGPLATEASVRGEEFFAEGLTPVLPHIVGHLLTRGSTELQIPSGLVELHPADLSQLLYSPSMVSTAPFQSGASAFNWVSTESYQAPGLNQDLHAGWGGFDVDAIPCAYPDRDLGIEAGVESSPDAFLTSARILDWALQTARKARESHPREWNQKTSASRWALIMGKQRAVSGKTTGVLRSRFWEPKSKKGAGAQPRKPAVSESIGVSSRRLGRLQAPFDAAVGQGAPASGLYNE